MLRDWKTTHRRIYLGLIVGDVRRRPTRREHPKTEHRDSNSEERQPRSVKSGSPQLRFRTVGHYRTGPSCRVCGGSGRSHVSHRSLAKVIGFRNKPRTSPFSLRCPLSYHVMRRVVGERDAWLFLKRWGTYPKWWCSGKSKSLV